MNSVSSCGVPKLKVAANWIYKEWCATEVHSHAFAVHLSKDVCEYSQEGYGIFFCHWCFRFQDSDCFELRKSCSRVVCSIFFCRIFSLCNLIEKSPDTIVLPTLILGVFAIKSCSCSDLSCNDAPQECRTISFIVFFITRMFRNFVDDILISVLFPGMPETGQSGYCG